MASISTYLRFNGNCREAMTFYNEVLGGELNFQTVGESPLSDNMPKQMQDSILHATLIKDSLVLMGSDMVPQTGLTKGNAVSLSLNCNSEEDLRNCYAKLSAGNPTDHPVERSFWGALFGDLTDKYGNCWLLSFNMNQQ